MTKRINTCLILLFVRRFFGNRSYCYDRMGQYEKALQDADVAISLAPDWPKGYFRRGRALAGLKVLTSAIFSGVLANRRLLRSCFAALRSWFRKLAPLPQPIRFKLMANWSLLFSRALWQVKKTSATSSTNQAQFLNQWRRCHSEFSALQAVSLFLLLLTIKAPS